MKTLQKFASVHASFHNHFNQERHLTSREPSRHNAQPPWLSGGPSWPKPRRGRGSCVSAETSCRWTDSTLVILPLLGIVLNGTSSVLYGTVPELAPHGDTGKAFAIFYTFVIGSGGLAPILYGAIADYSNQTVGILFAAGTAALIVPLILTLRPFLAQHAGGPALEKGSRPSHTRVMGRDTNG